MFWGYANEITTAMAQFRTKLRFTESLLRRPKNLEVRSRENLRPEIDVQINW